VLHIYDISHLRVNKPLLEGKRVDIDGGIVAADCTKFAQSSAKICHVVHSAPYK
jgi:hypothetical protein